MADTVKITPASRKVEFFNPDSASAKATISIDSGGAGDLTISAAGNINIGDISTDIYVGNGSDNVDIVYTADGEIRTEGAGVNLSLVSAENMTITTPNLLIGGNVGIGTTTATDSLAVRGGIKIGEFNDTDGTGYVSSSPPSAHNLGTGAADPQIRVSGRSTGNPGIIQLAQFDANNFMGGTTQFVLGQIQFAMNENTNAVTTVAEIRGISSDPHVPGHFDGALQFWTSQGDDSSANLTQKMILDANGNLGIGTTAPYSQLNIDMGGVFSNDNVTNENVGMVLKNDAAGNVAYAGLGLILDNTTDDANAQIRLARTSSTAYLGLQIISDSRDGVAFLTGNGSSTERMRIADDGKVGIGTDIPSRHLHVDAGTENLGGIQITSGGVNASLTITNDGTNGGEYRISVSSGNHGDGYNKLLFQDGTVTKMTLNSSGNLGIGITAPDTKLHILDSAEVALSVDSSHITGSQISLAATANGGSEWRLISAADNAGTTDGRGAFGLYNINGSNNGYKLVVEGTTGHVGIGTATPSEMLHVESADEVLGLFKSTDAGAGIKIDTPNDGYAVVFFSEAGTNKWSLGKLASNSDKFSIYDEVNTTPRLVIDTSGNVGIGTTTPVPLLHVYGNSTETTFSDAGAAGITIEQDGAGDAALSFLLTGIRRWLVGVDHSDADKFKISTGGTDLQTGTKLTIASDGNVGIGDTTPTYKLDVNGTLRATGNITADASVTAAGLLTSNIGAGAFQVVEIAGIVDAVSPATDTTAVFQHNGSLSSVVYSSSYVSTGSGTSANTNISLFTVNTNDDAVSPQIQSWVTNLVICDDTNNDQRSLVIHCMWTGGTGGTTHYEIISDIDTSNGAYPFKITHSPMANGHQYPTMVIRPTRATSGAGNLNIRWHVTGLVANAIAG